MIFFSCIAIFAAAAYIVWPRRPPDVLVLGDSVTFQASPAIQSRLDSRFDLELKAYPFYRSTDLEGILKQIIQRWRKAGRTFDSAVFLVGYNDVLRDQVGAPALVRMMHESEAFDCAVWLTLPATPGGRPASNLDLVPARVDAWNARLYLEAQGNTHLRVSTAWADVVSAPGGQELLQPDGIHPGESGRAALGAAIESALRDNCR